MLPSTYQPKIRGRIVEWIVVYVVNVHPCGDWAEIVDKNLPMKRLRRRFPGIVPPVIHAMISLCPFWLPSVYLAIVVDGRWLHM